MPQTTLLILIGALGILTGYLFACLPRYARRRQARRKQTKTPKGNALEQSVLSKAFKGEL